ncbi:hypothetical protein CDL15_Pgr014589 [Punica granatum]|uniref:Uncharacterized protein n=1 Tax=Punica granatum TaxID=22663 RepID=A0A218WDL5_PUNGR|nr:hypothetical protein CDL15_Pgr014589 [Punica granatum]
MVKRKQPESVGQGMNSKFEGKPSKDPFACKARKSSSSGPPTPPYEGKMLMAIWSTQMKVLLKCSAKWLWQP